MQLKKVSYSSAVFFGAVVLVLQFLTGVVVSIINRANPSFLKVMFGPSYNFPGEIALILGGPIILGLSSYVTALIAIFVYNQISQKFPISWTVKK